MPSRVVHFLVFSPANLFASSVKNNGEQTLLPRCDGAADFYCSYNTCSVCLSHCEPEKIISRLSINWYVEIWPTFWRSVILNPRVQCSLNSILDKTNQFYVYRYEAPPPVSCHILFLFPPQCWYIALSSWTTNFIGLYSLITRVTAQRVVSNLSAWSGVFMT